MGQLAATPGRVLRNSLIGAGIIIALAGAGVWYGFLKYKAYKKIAQPPAGLVAGKDIVSGKSTTVQRQVAVVRHTKGVGSEYSEYAGSPLPRSAPEAQGISSEAVFQFVEAVNKINTLHSFMLVRHGYVIADGWWKPEAPNKPHILLSLSKSFNSTAVGLAIAEGKLSLGDHVLKFFAADAPPYPSDNLKALTVRDLLTMTGGQATEPHIERGSPMIKQFFAHPFLYKPGSHFVYNSIGAYTLSAIVTKVTKRTVLEYLKPRLFEPLGIKNPQWSTTGGYSAGGWGLMLCTEDIAKFGQLYLQKGNWNGRQLIPQEWVEESTGKQVGNDPNAFSRNGPDWRQGYGFQFWHCTHNAFRGDGANGQLCVVIPDKDVVIAITADTGHSPHGMSAEMDAIWNCLYPAFQSAALPGNPSADAQLAQATAALTAHP